MPIVNIRRLHPTAFRRLTRLKIELQFTKMLVARLLDQIDGHPDAYLSDFDKEAIDLMKSLHPQNKANANFEGISLDEWESMNPGYVVEYGKED